VIRPFGYSTIEKKNLDASKRKKVVTYGSVFTECYYDELRYKGFDVDKLEHDYGGPETLAQYKAYIEIPYQVSTMKVT
jgi:hypothetical protein